MLREEDLDGDVNPREGGRKGKRREGRRASLHGGVVPPEGGQEDIHQLPVGGHLGRNLHQKDESERREEGGRE